jgi:hypothetical protein
MMVVVTGCFSGGNHSSGLGQQLRGSMSSTRARGHTHSGGHQCHWLPNRAARNSADREHKAVVGGLTTAARSGWESLAPPTQTFLAPASPTIWKCSQRRLHGNVSTHATTSSSSTSRKENKRRRGQMQVNVTSLESSRRHGTTRVECFGVVMHA